MKYHWHVEGQCVCQNLEAKISVAEVDLNPKPLSNPTWTVTHSKVLMNVIIGYESH